MYNENIETIKSTLKSIAMAEVIIFPKHEYRTFFYREKWNKNQEVAIMNDGSGDEWFLWFEDDFMAWTVNAHEIGSYHNIQLIYNNTPKGYEGFMKESAFSFERATCTWFYVNNDWQKYGIEDQLITEYFETFTWTPIDYVLWSEINNEIEVDISAIEKLFNFELTQEVVSLLNEEISIKDIQSEIEEIGFFS